ncbi:MAG: hypothetical protein AAF192_00125 [Pseudomonadota bacterium]
MHALTRWTAAAALALTAGTTLALSAGSALATTTTDLTFDGFEAGSRVVRVQARAGGEAQNFHAYAGTFSVTGTNPGKSFIAWCIDIATSLHQEGTSRTYVRQNVLTTEQRGDLERLFAAAYDEDAVLASQVKTAAFQVAIWDAIYDDDWDAGDFHWKKVSDPSEPDYFKIRDGWQSQNHWAVRKQANAYLALARDFAGPTPTVKLVEYDGRASNTQSLVAISMPLPAGAMLLLGGFGLAALVRRRRRGGA